ncbi:MAG TPA: CocE/NonD family hydrolase [Candidatus Binataceae bacterium]|nr:CocE/NonD family hydrolase [Candidatus Binataceae bacterium]
MIDEKDVLVSMRDGARLGARIYRPDSGRSPALLAIGPYRYDNNQLPPSPQFLWRETGPIEWYVSQGYAFVHVDVRGTGISDGEFGLLDRIEQQDMFDVVEWIARQPWCSGKVGGIGESYYCMAQWFMGAVNPPHLACIAPYDGMTDPYRYLAYQGGIEGYFPSFWYTISVRLPNLHPANRDHPREVTRDLMLDIQRHPFYDEFWRERAAVEQLDKIQVPAFIIGVWAKNDFHLPGMLIGYERVRGPRKLLITATASPLTALLDFASVEFHQKYLLPFYDRYLKDQQNGFENRPNVEYAVHNTGVIRCFETWPPPGVKRRRLFLAKGPSGSVSSLNDGLLAPAPSPGGGSTTYSYPQPTWLGVVVGPQPPDPVRQVLTFTTPTLDKDLELAGGAKLVLYASSTRDDMDFLVKVCEQFAQEPAAGMQPRFRVVGRGWLRASHQERDPRFDREDAPYYTHARAVPLEPGKIYQIEIAIVPCAYRFSKGNRIRLEIACTDSPVFDPLSMHMYRPDKIGADTIFHDAKYPSYLELPVLDAE